MGKAFKTKPIKEGGKNPNQHHKAPQANKKSKHKLYFTNLQIAPTSPNPYITCIVNNIDLIITLNKELDKEIPQNNSRIKNHGKYSIANPEPC